MLVKSRKTKGLADGCELTGGDQVGDSTTSEGVFLCNENAMLMYITCLPGRRANSWHFYFAITCINLRNYLRVLALFSPAWLRMVGWYGIICSSE